MCSVESTGTCIYTSSVNRTLPYQDDVVWIFYKDLHTYSGMETVQHTTEFITSRSEDIIIEV